MVFDDFKCFDCDIIEEHSKKSKIDPFPDFNCPTCGKVMIKLMGTPMTDIAKGRLGNSETGYEDEICYKPSKLGKFKTKKVK